jgi:hypothetical protein
VAAKALSVRGRGVTSSVQQVEVLTPDVSMATMKRQHRSLLGLSAEWTTRSRDQEGPCGPSRFRDVFARAGGSYRIVAAAAMHELGGSADFRRSLCLKRLASVGRTPCPTCSNSAGQTTCTAVHVDIGRAHQDGESLPTAPRANRSPPTAEPTTITTTYERKSIILLLDTYDGASCPVPLAQLPKNVKRTQLPTATRDQRTSGPFPVIPQLTSS